MARFITLAGKKQVGKDTSAQYIEQMLTAQDQWEPYSDKWHEVAGVAPKHHVHIVHFADALKQACHHVFGIDRRDMETEEGKQKLTHLLWPTNYAKDYKDPGGMHPFAVWMPHIDVMQPDLGRKHMTVREVLQFVGTELFRNQLDPDVWVQSVYRRPYSAEDVVIVADCRFPNEAKFAKEHGVLVKIERETGLGGDSHASETALDDFSDYHHVIDNNKGFDDLKASLRVVLQQEGIL